MSFFKTILLSKFAEKIKYYVTLAPIQHKKLILKYFIIGIAAGGLGQYIQRQISPSKEIIQKQPQQILLVGASGTGKTKTFRKIAQNNDTKNFDHIEISDGVSIVDTPSIEFEDDIDLREQIIKEFQTYFQNNIYSIAWFAIFVKFERTDIMKKKITQVFKYINKFKAKISIVVTDFQLSEDQEKDKKDLIKSLSIYGNQDKIIFISNNDSIKDMKNHFTNLILIKPSNIETQ